jgi:hypothetical protein
MLQMKKTSAIEWKYTPLLFVGGGRKPQHDCGHEIIVPRAYALARTAGVIAFLIMDQVESRDVVW